MLRNGRAGYLSLEAKGQVCRGLGTYIYVFYVGGGKVNVKKKNDDLEMVSFAHTLCFFFKVKVKPYLPTQNTAHTILTSRTRACTFVPPLHLR